MKLFFYSLILISFLSFKGIVFWEVLSKGKIKITQKNMAGDWKTGEGIKYNYYNNNVTSEQPLQAQYYLMKYRSDSTMWHDGHQKVLTWRVIPGNRIMYDYNTPEERYYKVEIYTKEKMQVYGPFTREGKRFNPDALFRLIQYKVPRANK